MDVLARIERHGKQTRRFVERRAEAFVLRCDDLGVKPNRARSLVMSGGGKDSTLALIFSRAVSDLTGSSVDAVTMAHPGISLGTIRNIERVTDYLQVPHRWMQFGRTLDGAHSDCEQWYRLYRALAVATDLNPRFMCVACNFGSIAVEIQAIKELRSDFRITGNSSYELGRFDEWADDLKRAFSKMVSFPETVGQPTLDYYRLWWAVYNQLLVELAPFGSRDDGDFPINDYLYALPLKTDDIGRAIPFNILEDEDTTYVPLDFRGLLDAFDWRLPDDIQAGTESDCAMPAAIAAIDIERNGLSTYLSHLAEAAAELSPLPEMYARATQWATEGRSAFEGQKLLSAMDVAWTTDRVANNGTAIAKALVSQLLTVR